METLSEQFKMHLLDCLPSLNVMLGQISTLAAADTQRREVWNPKRQLCPSTAVYRGPRTAMEPDAGPCQSALRPPRSSHSISSYRTAPLDELHLWKEGVEDCFPTRKRWCPSVFLPLNVSAPSILPRSLNTLVADGRSRDRLVRSKAPKHPHMPLASGCSLLVFTPCWWWRAPQSTPPVATSDFLPCVRKRVIRVEVLCVWCRHHKSGPWQYLNLWNAKAI